MIGCTRSTIVPLAMWTEHPPVHNITSILNLEKSNVLLTGSESGHIIIWSAKTCDNQLVPINYMIAHRSKVVTLALAGSRKLTDIDYFVSFSKDGELGLWDAGNGRSIEFVSNPSFDVQSVFSYESENMKQRLLFCCLKSPEIVIIKSMSLSEVCTLICTNSPNLFSSVTSFNISTKDDIIFASTVSGQTSMWVLNFEDINNKSDFNPKFNADESLKVDLSDPIKITHNPYHKSIILIISACKFLVYHAKNWSILCYKTSTRGDYFINGEFISTQCILMHCQSGKSVYYKLPPRSDYGDPSFGRRSSIICDSIPKLICQFKEPTLLTSRHKVTTQITEYGFIIWKGYADGIICKWEFKANAIDIEPQVFSLSNAWKAMKKTPASLSNTFKDDAACGSVTSLLYIPDLSLFILGMHNGSIFITNLENSIAGIFKKTPQVDKHFIKLIGHNGPVLCLIHPCSTMKLPSRLISCTNLKMKPCIELFKQARYLWSGSEDFSIRVWDIKNQLCLTVFNCHSAPVILLRLNHLAQTGTNACGFNQEMTAAMLHNVSDEDPNNVEIKHMINTCMNAFMVVISDDDAISIITMMKRKLLLHSIEHDSPVRSLGWFLDSGYLLLETIKDTVYVWDISSKSMDRFETDKMAESLMEMCTVTTKIRSRSSGKVISGTDMISRHSLSNLTSYNCCTRVSAPNKYIKFQFIKSGCSARHVPVIIFDLSTLLNSLNIPSPTSKQFYSYLSEMDNSILQGFQNNETISIFDKLMMNGTAVNRDMDLKILLIKLILSLAHLQHNSCQLDAIIFKFLDIKSEMVSCSFGNVNSKTGCITFNIEDLFKDQSEMPLTVDNILLQLSISNRITNPSNRSRLDSIASTSSNINAECDFTLPSTHSASGLSYNFSDCLSSTKFTELLLAYKKSILDKHVPILVKKTSKKNRFSDCPEHLTFYAMEQVFHSLILSIMDVSDWISMSAYQILVKVIADLSFQEIQNYLLIIRKILLPDLDHYTTEGGRNLSARIQPYLHKFSEQSFLASDWIWWYSPITIKIDQDKRKLTKIQIKALVYLSLIGTYLSSDDSFKSKDDVKVFGKVFSLDNFFLARITCDFLLELLTVDVATVKRTKNRLISLAMLCLSNGFTVWEPHLNSTILIGKLFEFTDETDDENDDEEDGFLLSSLAKQSLRTIALTKPLAFVMSCYLKLQNDVVAGPVSLNLGAKKLHRMQSSPAMINSYDSDSGKNKTGTLKVKKNKKIKELSNPTILKKTILFPILDELCEIKSEIIGGMLPEIVELYLICQARYGQREVLIQHLLHHVLRFSSVAIHSTSGQVAVGSAYGVLALFDHKIGKYFTHPAHLRPIKFTQFSHDAKHLATYSVEEGMLKIWQICHTGLFRMGNSPYNVKLTQSHAVPSIDEMIAKLQSNTASDETDKDSKEMKKKGLKKTLSKIDKPSYLISTDAGLGLSWSFDNKNLSITFNSVDLQKFKL